jgi:hypothetical protein
MECRKKGGVFKTYQAYLQKQYDNSVCLDNKKNAIYSISSNKLVLRSEGNKSVFKHQDIYGYFDGESTYRYFINTGAKGAKGYFRIEDTSGLIIYSQKHHHFRNNSIGFYYSIG